ncbi:acyl-CoA thioesterase [Hydrogenophaga sp. UC242_50]|jgi:acyl-CoA thioester hydrolase|uniref:acyl-CoA thioesterase n=1 Tax=unclassified Hydrogenophaga TaxID=2610897 RepID=UPI0036D34164
MSASVSTERDPEPLDGRWHWTMPVRVRWTDLDALGHVHHLVYLRWCEDARNEHAEAIGLPLPGTGARSQVVVAMACDFRQPVGRGAEPSVCLRVTRVGRTSLEARFGIQVDGVAHFAARVTTVMCEDRTGQASPWTPAERERLLAGPVPA